MAKYNLVKQKSEQNCVWFYFLRDKSKDIAKCKKCNKLIKQVELPVVNIHLSNSNLFLLHIMNNDKL
jgi:hypothetical protein